MDTVAVTQHKLAGAITGEVMMPVLHYLPPSPPSRAVLLLGRMLNVEFELKQVNLMEGEHLKPEFLQLNPQHTIPVLEDHGLVLWESRAILTYLVSAYSKDDGLYPRDIRVRAVVDSRLQFDLGILYSRLTDYYFPVIFMNGKLDPAKKGRIEEALGFLDTFLKGRTWAAANQFTVADLSLTVTISQLEAFGMDLSPYSRINNWYQRCKEELMPHGYVEINQQGADTLAGVLRSKLKS